MDLDLYLQRQILLTLSYSAQFSFPLTATEIWLRLISSRSFSLDSVKSALETLEFNKKLLKKNEYYFLANYFIEPTTREQRAEYSQVKLHEAQECVSLLRKIPWIHSVAVTGSVAVSNAKRDDDVDFFIVTDAKRLWLTRALVIAIALYKGKRRSWKGEEKNSWCFNMWADTAHLQMPQSLHTVYGAYEICQALWLYVRKGSDISSFYTKNAWVERYMPHYYRQQLSTVILPHSRLNHATNIVLDLLEKLAYTAQKMYMKSHVTRETVTRNVAFFHPRDTKGIIYSFWRSILQTL